MAINKVKPFSSRLLVRPFPLKGESLRGYLMRVGERNGYGRGINLYKRLTGNSSKTYLISEQAIDSVAKSTELSRDPIALMSYRRIPDDFRQCIFFGHLINMDQLRSAKPAICPDCLNEQQALSGLWDLNAVCACPHHGKWLVDQCPACGEGLTWRRPYMSLCQCGFDLRTVEAKPAPSDVVALMALIYARTINDVPMYDGHPWFMPEVVTKISLNCLLALFDPVSSLAWRRPIAMQLHGCATERFSRKCQAAVLLAQLLISRPGDQLMLLAVYSDSMTEASTLASLTRKPFEKNYWQIQRLAQLAPALFKQTAQQFMDEHCIDVKGRGRFLEPSAVWRDSNGQRVLKLKTCLVAIGLPIKGVHEDEVISFATYLQMKAEIFGVPDRNRCSRPSYVAMAEIPPCPEPR